MSNVNVSSPIVIFRDESKHLDSAYEIHCLEYLWRREMAERAAAKNSSSEAGRRVHQELAQMYSSKRLARSNA